MKTCTKCQESKKMSDFYSDKSKKDGKNSFCKQCQTLKNYKWSKKNNDYNAKYAKDWRSTRKISEKDKKLKSRYGITMNEFEELNKKQNKVCAICGGINRDRTLAVDHCHDTGNVRGLLCSRCNIGLGLFKDNQKLLAKAIDYLKMFTKKY